MYNAVDYVAEGSDDMKDGCNVYLKKFGLCLKDILMTRMRSASVQNSRLF
jgi:hypothetical protein